MLIESVGLKMIHGSGPPPVGRAADWLRKQWGQQALGRPGF
jgi:hypothetical protein